MIALTKDKLTNAIAKARKLRPRVQYLWWRTYLVTSPNSGNQYLVKFSITNGQKFADCSCKAGQNQMACFHVAAAVSVQIGVAAMRLAARKQTPRTSTHEYHSHQDTPFNLPEHRHTCPECQTSEPCTAEMCEARADGSYQDALYGACLDRREMAA